MDSLIAKLRAPYEARLNETLAITDGLLYRRGNFNGSWDQLICDALIDVQGADIALSPGFRWGTSLLPGETITRELMMDQLAITYPNTTISQMSGETLKTRARGRRRQPVQSRSVLPARRRHGARWRHDLHDHTGAAMGHASATCACGKPIEADKTYKVAGWASVSEEARRPAPAGVGGRRGLAANKAGTCARRSTRPSWWAWRATRAGS